MIEDRIGELRIRVRTDVPNADAIRPAAEGIVRAALERCTALLEERHPGCVVLVRRLPLRWKLDESVLDDITQVDHLARAAADAIESRASSPVLELSPSDDGVVIFDDEPHLRASHLLALARGRSAWFHEALEDAAVADPLAALAAPEHRSIARATLVRLAREGVLAEVLATQPCSTLAALEAALGCDTFPSLPIPEESEHVIGGSAAIGKLTAIASHWPALSPTARLLALRVHAAVLLDAEPQSPAAVALAATLQQDSGSLRRLRVEADDRSVTFPSPIDDSQELAGEDPESEEASEVVATRCAGLFYLLDRIQELDLAESLWKACLPEGAVLAAGASALLGPSFVGDSAPALFGGVDATIVCPEVTLEQHAEIATATCAALVAALPRRALAGIPPAVVALVDHAAGRLLVASAVGSPFAFFAWPAATPEMLIPGLHALLDTWPHRGALCSMPSLATLDTSGRLRPCRDATPRPLLLPKAASASSTALLALVAGAPCMLFAARAGAPANDTVKAFVARYLARPARIRIGPERMDVILSVDDLNFDARRAGLDRDPGWLPWLRRTVRFVFVEREPVASPPAAVSSGGEER
jgi:hypothetical protein